jgi:hypothetical protein
MSQKIIDKQRIEKGSYYIIIGFFYSAFAGATFLTNSFDIPFLNSSNMAKYSASIGNLMVGVAIIIIGFLLIRRRPLKDLKQLGIISMGYGYGLFILGMLVVIGINLQPGYLIPNIIMFILTIPVFIMGLILLFKGLHLYRE